MILEVSVVIPTCRRPEMLARCLEALARQTLPADRYEVIIVDDARDPQTMQAVVHAAAHAKCRFQYTAVPGPTHGPAAARNLGWRAARAPIVAFTDDDCVPEPGWLEAGVATIEHGVEAAAGAIVMPLPPRPTDYERDASGLTKGEFVTANCFCQRWVLERVGGFDENFTAAWREDSDLQFSLLERGLQIARAADAVVVHPVRPAPWGISLLQQKKTQFNALLFRKHPQLYRERLAPFPRLYYVINVALAATLAALLFRSAVWHAFAAGWMALTAWLFLNRLRGNSHAPAHIAEMAITSILVPPLSLYWHLRGMFRFKTFFA